MQLVIIPMPKLMKLTLIEMKLREKILICMKMVMEIKDIKVD